MTEVQVQYSDGRTERVRLRKASTVIGREEGCDIRLRERPGEKYTGRRHARLYRDGEGQYWIEDLQSKNGTTVNDQLVGVSRVSYGDRIGIGSCVLILRPVTDSPISLVDDVQTSFGSTSIWRSDQRLHLPQQRLEKLYELNERVTGLFDRDELLREVMNVCLETLGFDRGGIALWPGDPHPPLWVVRRDRAGRPEDEFRVSGSVVRRALQRAERILVNDVSTDAVPSESMISNNIRSAMCVPLIYHDRVHGVLYGDRVTPATGYTKEDVDFFAALGRQAALALVNCNLLEELQRRQAIEMQLSLAREIQNRLFPREPLILGRVSIDALNDPGQQVSGDYYDYFVRPDGLIAVVIADVVGKGVPASLLMANLQAAVHVTLLETRDLSRAVALLNRLVCRNVDAGRFITGIVGLFDPAASRFEFVNAGHPQPTYIHPDGTIHSLVGETHWPLGIESEAEYSQARFEVPREGGSLFLYTDGVPDAQNREHEVFGEARIHAALKRCAADMPRRQLDVVRQAVEGFSQNAPQTDDITMMSVRIVP
jgi:sigma-B regulation protein RsbU (phosphoserine phosphatase)